MVNKHNDLGSRPPAKNAKAEAPDISQAATQVDLFRNIIDEWVVPALVKVFIKEKIDKDRHIIRDRGIKKLSESVINNAIPLVDDEGNMQKFNSK